MRRRLIFEICANCGNKIVDDEAAILVDDDNDLIYCNEGCIREYFESDIERIEEEHLKQRTPKDIPVAEFTKFENYLQPLLGEPDEIWEVDVKEEQPPLGFFIGEFLDKEAPLFYIAAVYLSGEKAVFVYSHFPTRDLELVQKYRRDELIYDSSESEENLESQDDVDEDNPGIDLFEEMLENRSESDIDPEEFHTYGELKKATMETPEEVWRRIDDAGNSLLIFIAHHVKGAETIAYVVVGLEEDVNEQVMPLFGFPTLDQKMVDRFRGGELVFSADDEEEF